MEPNGTVISPASRTASTGFQTTYSRATGTRQGATAFQQGINRFVGVFDYYSAAQPT